MIRGREWLCVVLITVVGLVVLTGCGKDETAARTEEPAASTEPAAKEQPEKIASIPIADEAAVKAKLAEADRLDGRTDKVITRCWSCGLGMDGSPENTYTVAGYTLHFCTPHCREAFTHDVENAVLAMELPELK